MSGPTDSLKPAALFAAMCQMPRPFSVVEFPRVDPLGNSIGFVHIQVLTQHERMSAMAESEKWVRRLLKEDFPKTGEMAQGYLDMRSNELATQMLYRACKQVDAPEQPFFPSIEAARKELSGDEIGVLYSKYLIVQAERGPIVAEMVDDDVEAWVKRLVEGASRDPLGVLSLEAQMDLVMLLASRLYPSLIGSGSSGKPADGSTEPDDVDDVTES